MWSEKWLVWHLGDCGMCVVEKMSKVIGVTIHKSNVVYM